MFFLALAILVITVIFSLPKFKGLIGESEVRLLLKRLDPNAYISIHNVMIPNNGKTTQIDHIVVSIYGIFVIETKNYKGWIYGNEKNKFWTQVIYKRKEKFYNPIHQNFGHIKALEDLLGEEYPGPFFSIISFGTRSTLKKIDVQSPNVDVLYSSRVIKKIISINQSVIPSSKVKSLAEKIATASSSGEKHANREHVKAIKTTIKEQQTKVKGNICPKCAGQLVQRTGKYGKFFGCSNYPKCRFVVKK